MYELKKQLSVNLTIMLECEHDITQKQAEEELTKLLDSVTTLTDFRLIFSQYEKLTFKDVTA